MFHVPYSDRKLLTDEDFEKLNAITADEDDSSDEGASLLVHLRNVLKRYAGSKTIEGGLQGAVITEHETIPMGAIEAEYLDPNGQVGGKHGLSFRFRKYLQKMGENEQWEVIRQRALCSGCRQEPNNPQVTSW